MQDTAFVVPATDFTTQLRLSLSQLVDPLGRLLQSSLEVSQSHLGLTLLRRRQLQSLLRFAPAIPVPHLEQLLQLPRFFLVPLRFLGPLIQTLKTGADLANYVVHAYHIVPHILQLGQRSITLRLVDGDPSSLLEDGTPLQRPHTQTGIHGPLPYDGVRVAAEASLCQQLHYVAQPYTVAVQIVLVLS